jgi:hypothetical protein
MKRSRFPSKKPEGQSTRGKTAANRLRRVDNFLLLYDPALLRRMGISPAPSSWTWATARKRLPRLNPRSASAG